MKEIFVKKLNKTILAKEYEDLSHLEKEVLELCQRNPLCANSNTELVIEFWKEKQRGGLFSTIREYPPETLTKIRRNLTLWGLLTPAKEITEKREEIEKSYHNIPSNALFEMEARQTINRLTGEKLNY